MVPGASVAVRYRPGAAEEEVGGDWYDVLALPSGDVGVVIGDVLGHDLQAAAKMAHARSALRAYAAEGHPPAAVVELLDRLLAWTDPDFLGTCCYLQFDARTGRVTVVSAGHPPPVLVTADGAARALELDANLPLGVEPGTPFRERQPASTRRHAGALHRRAHREPERAAGGGPCATAGRSGCDGPR